MAERVEVQEVLRQWGDKIITITWSGLLNTDTGRPVELPLYADKCAQVIGTFGAGGNLRMQGSNDGTNWAALTDPQGNDVNITATKFEQLLELTRYVRPNVTAGDGTTNLSVVMILRRSV